MRFVKKIKKSDLEQAPPPRKAAEQEEELKLHERPAVIPERELDFALLGPRTNLWEARE